VSLTYIFGIGPSLSRKILEQTGVEPTTKMGERSEDDVNRLRDVIGKEYRVEGELRKEINLNIKRLIEIGSYRGTRHRRNLPARGQRTRTNARTRRGPRKTVAGRGQRRGGSAKK
jgi:small subunit ribosomal protein S13